MKPPILKKSEAAGAIVVVVLSVLLFVIPRIIDSRRVYFVKPKLEKQNEIEKESSRLIQSQVQATENDNKKLRKLHLKYCSTEELLELGIEENLAHLIIKKYSEKKRFSTAEEFSAFSGLPLNTIQLRISPKSFSNFYYSLEKIT